MSTRTSDLSSLDSEGEDAPVEQTSSRAPYDVNYHTLNNHDACPPADTESRDAEPPSKTVRRHRAIGPGAAGWEAPRAFDVDELEVSEDTDGSMPPSPAMGDMEDERTLVEPQVTTCRWEGCEVGDLGNMDLLVEHIHEEHIHARQKRYSCEWDGCGRKGFSHASAYALRAHMRSHTKEKPFYCSLPECDRSFTRSDALAKHMRTIHETESHRVIDPPAKPSFSLLPPAKFTQSKKLASVKAGGGDGGGGTDQTQARSPKDEVSEWAHDNVMYERAETPNSANVSPTGRYVFDFGDWANRDKKAGKNADSHTTKGTLLERKFPPDVSFTDEELSMPPSKLYKQLKLQSKWSSELNANLRAELESLTKQQKREWAMKECLLEKVMEAELETFEAQLGSKGKLDDPLMRRIVNEMRKDLEKDSLPTPLGENTSEVAATAKAVQTAKASTTATEAESPAVPVPTIVTKTRGKPGPKPKSVINLAGDSSLAKPGLAEGTRHEHSDDRMMVD